MWFRRLVLGSQLLFLLKRQIIWVFIGVQRLPSFLFKTQSWPKYLLLPSSHIRQSEGKLKFAIAAQNKDECNAIPFLFSWVQRSIKYQNFDLRSSRGAIGGSDTMVEPWPSADSSTLMGLLSSMSMNKRSLNLNESLKKSISSESRVTTFSIEVKRNSFTWNIDTNFQVTYLVVSQKGPKRGSWKKHSTQQMTSEKSVQTGKLRLGAESYWFQVKAELVTESIVCWQSTL